MALRAYASRARRARSARLLFAAVVTALGLGIGVSLTLHSAFVALAHAELPFVPGVDPGSVFMDSRPIHVVTTANWVKVPMVVSRDAVTSDHTLWLKMHFEDWDGLPDDIRGAGLTNIVRRYGGLIDDVFAWRRMQAEDWDYVPQPARAMAFLNMISHWTHYYDVGRGYGVERRLLIDTLQAVAMSESWFEHRGVHVNRDGSQDIGLGGASEYARRTVRTMHAAERLDFSLSDDEYFDPFKASRMLTVWFQIMLDEADGNVDVAIRAYNRGIGQARLGEGQEYLEGVKRRRRRYIRNEGESRAWRFLNDVRRSNELAAGAGVMSQRAENGLQNETRISQ
jgi:hypothetical protein